ncbi:hypothetical protein MTR_3g026060 [Medicago truncatula]|uniref:Uncharacterized protein n=1 Tax=Medicago truncatula TaxID=3880 RepID=G7IZC5_MEDTR|nr:hypothetical protein MTR_3g026060 [Medicago truncatula]
MSSNSMSPKRYPFVRGLAHYRGQSDCHTKAREQQQHPRVVVVAQPTTVGDVTILAGDYNEFLQFKAAHQPSSAQSSNHVAFISTSSSLGLWVLDSAASNHMTGISSFRFHDPFVLICGGGCHGGHHQINAGAPITSTTEHNDSQAKSCGFPTIHGVLVIPPNSTTWTHSCNNSVLPDKKMQMLGSTKENKKLSNLFKQTHKTEFSRNIMKMIYLLKVDGSSYIFVEKA